MRRVVHRLLSAAPAVSAAYLAVWATAFPKKAVANYNNVSLLLMTDARFFWLCVGLITAYALLWWITSFEPPTRRILIQSGLRSHYEALSRVVHQIKEARAYEDFQALLPVLEGVLGGAAGWLQESMAPAAFEKFRAPPTATVSWSWPTEPQPGAAEERSNVIVLNEARVEALDTFLRYDGWDGEVPSAMQRFRERITTWKSKKTALIRF